MAISAGRMAALREHIHAESAHDIDALIGGMTPDCFNDVVGTPEPFVGPPRTAERYRKHWEGFPDFPVRVRRILCADESCVVTENEWRGTHLGTFMGWPATGKPVRMRAIVVWHFKGDALRGEWTAVPLQAEYSVWLTTLIHPSPSTSMDRRWWTSTREYRRSSICCG
jgi:steroid delta-isomerase-like uncharacterized protein